ncbi:UNVERIFIED_CONTAM: hypothetical protein Q9R58_07710 [Methylobacteriaceae bacterium AG10]|nr:hypothetical protein [Methylobacteriaceae bacterium AG10]
MTPAATPEALAEALALEIADILLDGGALSPKGFAQRLVAGPALQQVTAERDAARAENDRFRAGIANGSGPCAYCNLSREDWSKCRSGFPGCDRADDAMLCPHFGAEMEANDRADSATAEAASLRAERDAARTWAAEWHRVAETVLTVLGLSPALGGDEAAGAAVTAIRAAQAEVEAKDRALKDLRADADALGARLGNTSQYDDPKALRDLCWEAGNFLARRIVLPALARAATAREG